MADSDLATRATENDLQESEVNPNDPSSTTPQQPAPTPNDMLAHDTPAQSGPTMGEHCTSDRPLASSDPPKGDMTELAGIATYISKPTSYPSDPCKLLLLLTGGTGVHSPNNQHQADAFAARGFVVVMPDQFAGDAAPNTKTVSEEDAKEMVEAQNPSLLERIKLGAAETAKSFLIDMWLARHTPEKVLPVLQKVLESAREEFADAVANGDGVYGVGYCFGGKYVLRLCAESDAGAGKDEESQTLQGSQLKCGAIAHGTDITADDIAGVKVPVAIAAVSGDQLFPDDVREQGKATLAMNGVEHEVKVFEGVPHGFAVVGDYKDEKIESAQAEAFEFMAGWLEAR